MRLLCLSGSPRLSWERHDPAPLFLSFRVADNTRTNHMGSAMGSVMGDISSLMRASDSTVRFSMLAKFESSTLVVSLSRFHVRKVGQDSDPLWSRPASTQRSPQTDDSGFQLL